LIVNSFFFSFLAVLFPSSWQIQGILRLPRVVSLLNLQHLSVRSAELSACLKSFLSVCLNPLVAMPLLQLREFPVQAAARAGAHHDTCSNFTGGPSAEKKQKQTIPGLTGFE
jgi:hypothetical protein